jgi:predicted nucleotidyltransferase
MAKSPSTTNGLSERSIQTLSVIFSKYPDISEVHLFGSRAMGNFKAGSDIDLAIMNKGLQDKTVSRVLSDCAESSLPVAVDLVDFHSLTNPELIEHIKRIGVLFYKTNRPNPVSCLAGSPTTSANEKG